jgi:predicted DNA-binding protein
MSATKGNRNACKPPDMRKAKRVQVYLTDATYARLERRANESKRTMAYEAREIIERHT